MTKSSTLPWTKTTSPKIIRIIEVRDTREYEEVDERWVPIPGSGTVAICARCGREHEVHAEVELGDKTTAVVGTGCMTKGSLLAKKLAAGARAAKRLAALSAELTREKGRAKRYASVMRKVEAMTPLHITTTKVDDGRTVLRMGDARVWYHGDWPPARKSDQEEREQHLLRVWRRKRAAMLGVGYDERTASRQVIRLEEEIEKVRRRLAKSS